MTPEEYPVLVLFVINGIIKGIKELTAEINRLLKTSNQQKQYNDKKMMANRLANAKFMDVCLRLENNVYIRDENGRRVPVNLAVVDAQAKVDAWKEVFGSAKAQ